MNPNIAAAVALLIAFLLGLAIGYSIKNKEIEEEKSNDEIM